MLDGFDAFDDHGTPGLVVRDLGSRAGSFLDGEPLLPGEDVELLELLELSRSSSVRELGLGIATTFELWTQRGGAGADGDERPIALLREAGVADRSEPGEPHKLAWTLFTPLGGPLWLTPERLLPIKGTPPSLIDVPPGCPFHPRCDFSSRVPGERCTTERPEALDAGGEHRVACHLTPAQRRETWADEIAPRLA